MPTENTRVLGQAALANSSRRQFIASVLAAGAAASVARLAGADAAPAEPAKGVCTLGFSTYGTRSMKTEEALHMLREIGFDSAEIACMANWDADPANVSTDRRADLRRQFKDSGMKLACLMDDYHPSVDEKTNGRNAERLRLVAQLGHDLAPDQPIVLETMLAGSAPWAKMKPVFLRVLPDWLKVVEAADITLAIKPHRDTSMSRPEEAIELFNELGKPPRLRMCYDYSHFVHREMPLKQTVAASLPWTAFVSMKDTAIVNGKAAFKLPGETGDIDYAALIRQFYQGGYRGDFNCEISAQISKKKDYDPMVVAKQCYKNLAPAFVAAGVPRPGK